jgi:hypothetical protein
MYCKDCFHSSFDDNLSFRPRICCSPKFGNEGETDKSLNDTIEYSYDEGGCFEVGDNFGCIHFKKKG